MMFLRTILALKEDDVCRIILSKRSLEFSQNGNVAANNEYDSPIYDLLNTSVDVGLYDTVVRMITQGHLHSKEQWKKIVWESVWQKEDHDCTRLYREVRDPPDVVHHNR